MIPSQISFTDFPESDFIKQAVQKRIDKLEYFFDRIVRCEVVLACPHRHRHADRLYSVRVHLFIPGNDIIVSNAHAQDEAHRDIYVSIRDAFDATERILLDRIRILRHQVKNHALENSLTAGQNGKIPAILSQETALDETTSL